MDNIEQILAIVTSSLVLAGVIVGLVMKVINLAKAVKSGKLQDIIRSYVKEAEDSGKSGADKLQYVMDKIVEYCKEQGITSDVENLKRAIEDVVSDYNAFKNANKSEDKEK